MEEGGEPPPEEEEYIPSEDEVPPPRPRRKSVNHEASEELLKSLDKLSGREVVKILDYMHNKYLSWINEAEATKYFNVTARAFDEALRRQEATLEKLTTAFTDQLNRHLSTVLSSLEKRMEVIERKMDTVESKAGFRVDDRLLALGLLIIDAVSGKLGLDEMKPIIRQLLLKTAVDYLGVSGEKEEKGSE